MIALLSLDPTNPEGYDDEELTQLGLHLYQLGLRYVRIILDLGQIERALSLAYSLAHRHSEDPEVWHLLNEAELRNNNPHPAIQAALQTYRLDAGTPLPDWIPRGEQLHEKTIELLSGCPEPQIASLVEGPGLVITIHEAPALELVLEGVDPRATCLALAARKSDDQEPLLTGLAIYLRNVLRFATSAARFDRDLEMVIFEELANYFGLDDFRRQLLGLPPVPTTLVDSAEGRKASPAARGSKRKSSSKKKVASKASESKKSSSKATGAAKARSKSKRSPKKARAKKPKDE